MINKTEYAWEDIQVILPGKATPVEGISEIEYMTKRDHKNIYAKGHKPVAGGKGKTEFDGKIKLLQSEVEAMQRGLPTGKNLTDIPPFNVTVAYAPDNGIITTDQLVYCRFSEFKKGMKTGDTNMEVELKLVIGDILYNV